MSVRLVEAATKPRGWRGIENELRELKGRQILEKNFDKSRKHAAGLTNQPSNTDMPKTILVFFVGGVTYAEIAAIRMLEARPNNTWRYIVAATHIANGKQICDSFTQTYLKRKRDLEWTV